ncbi:MAG: L-threonylcarbamoyladenylate synthase [Patescibacteria group bacterium]
MKVIEVDLKNDFSKALDETFAVLKLGGVIVYPTDTLYGLGTNALEAGPVERIFKIKARAKDKPLPIIVKNLNWAKELAYIYEKEEKILKSVWPGPITVILPKKNIVPSAVTAGKSGVALRISKNHFVDKLLGRFGYPLTATSANISGEEPSMKISEIVEVFKNVHNKPDLIIDAGDLPQSEPSTVLDLTSDKPKILRVGPVKPETLRKILEI